MDWIIPQKTTVKERMRKHQEIQKKYHDNSRSIREFREGELVWAKNFYTGPRWKKGVVKRWTGPVSYEIKLESGTVVRRHGDHVKKQMELDADRASEIGRTSPQNRNQNLDTDWLIPLTSGTSSPGSFSPDQETTNGVGNTQQEAPVRETIRCSERTKNKPKHLKDYVT